MTKNPQPFAIWFVVEFLIRNIIYCKFVINFTNYSYLNFFLIIWCCIFYGYFAYLAWCLTDIGVKSSYKKYKILNKSVFNEMFEL